jgi:hypothetical protein
MRAFIVNASSVVVFLFAAWIIPVTVENTVEEADAYRLMFLAVMLGSFAWLVTVGYFFGKGPQSRALVTFWAGLLAIVLFGLWWNDPVTQWDRALEYSSETRMTVSFGDSEQASGDVDRQFQDSQYKQYLVATARLEATPMAQRERGEGLGITLYVVYAVISLLIMLGLVVGTSRYSDHSDR